MNNILNSEEMEDIRKVAKKKSKKACMIDFLVYEVVLFSFALLLIHSIGVSLENDRHFIILVIVIAHVFVVIGTWAGRITYNSPNSFMVVEIERTVLSIFDKYSEMEVIPKNNDEYFAFLKEQYKFYAYKSDNKKIEIKIRHNENEEEKEVSFCTLFPKEFYEKYYLVK